MHVRVLHSNVDVNHLLLLGSCLEFAMSYDLAFARRILKPNDYLCGELGNQNMYSREKLGGAADFIERSSEVLGLGCRKGRITGRQ